jgi:hypothetical protein
MKSRSTKQYIPPALHLERATRSSRCPLFAHRTEARPARDAKSFAHLAKLIVYPSRACRGPRPTCAASPLDIVLPISVGGIDVIIWVLSS